MSYVEPKYASQYNHLAIDRYAHTEYHIDDATHKRIIDMINFYHESIYSFPDDERVEAKIFGENGDLIGCRVSINRLIFE
ncbi:MAG: hypothetical protein RIA69_01815 [Cyclobacteriaceae bacterium]